MSWIPLPQPNFNNFQTIDIQNLELKFNNLVNSINGVFDNILTPTVGGVAVKAKIFAQADSTIPATTLTGTILAGALNQANQRFTSDIVFSTLDYDTVQWTAGTIRFNDGTTYAISAGNTGNMTALTFIYFDSALSTTTLKVTTDYNLLAPPTAVLLADAKNAPTTDLNPFWVAYNSANLNVNQLSVNYLSALSGDMGTLTAGTITLDGSGHIKSGMTAYATGTGFWLGKDGATTKFSIGNSSGARLLWDGTNLSVGRSSGRRIELNPATYIRGYEPDPALPSNDLLVLEVKPNNDTVDVFTEINGSKLFIGDGGAIVGNFMRLYSGTVEVLGNLTTANQITITKATGTAPLAITSTTVCTNLNADMVDGQHLSAIVPSGVIVLWSGSIASIPSGWVLCNGLNGTPDLRDRFIVGAGSTYAVAATGGSATHTLTTSEMPTHNHGVTDGGHSHGVTDSGHTHTASSVANSGASGFNQYASGTGWYHGNITTASATTGVAINSATTGITIDNTGSGGSHENRPPYYALAYIMKT